MRKQKVPWALTMAERERVRAIIPQASHRRRKKLTLPESCWWSKYNSSSLHVKDYMRKMEGSLRNAHITMHGTRHVESCIKRGSNARNEGLTQN